MNRTDRYILSCPTWDEFYRRTGSLSKADKGRIFERLVQLYLQTATEYRSILRDVWHDYCRSGERPGGVPSNPNSTYAKVGWAGYADWLGYA
jgi:hypothetical protein